ncbi:MAG: tetratricopeptide repeat protein [Flavobacteriia bacterium]|nr:tetratricopeptide repeat protein [Flavobacteriia bacterium]
MGQMPMEKDPDADFKASFWEAQTLKMTDRDRAALSAFKRCDSIRPDQAMVLSELARLSHELKDAAAAMDYAERSLVAEGVRDWHWEEAARIHYELDLLEPTADILERYLRQTVPKAETFETLAAVYMEMRDWPSAVRTLDALEKKTGITEEISEQKKQLYLEMGELEKAIEQLDRLIRAYPADLRYRLEKAEMYAANDRIDEARALWEDVLKRYPEQPVANLRLARYFQAQGAYDKSYSCLKVAMASEELDIDDKVAVLLNMYIHSEGDSALTAATFELAELTVRSAPMDAKSWSVKGDLHMRDEQFEDAYECFAQAVQLPNGNKYEIWEQMLLLSGQQAEWSRLERDAKKAADRFPAEPFPLFMLGVGQMQSDAPQLAIDSWEEALDLSFGNRFIREQIFTNLGQAYHELGDHERSDQAFEKALKLDPDNALSLNNYAYFLAERGENLSQALEMTIRSNKIDPDNPTYLDTWAWVLYQNAQYQEALQKQERALVVSEEPSADLFDHYGDILFQLGMTEQALKKWKRALELGTEDQEKIREKIKENELEE